MSALYQIEGDLSVLHKLNGDLIFMVRRENRGKNAPSGNLKDSNTKELVSNCGNFHFQQRRKAHFDLRGRQEDVPELYRQAHRNNQRLEWIGYLIVCLDSFEHDEDLQLFRLLPTFSKGRS